MPAEIIDRRETIANAFEELEAEASTDDSAAPPPPAEAPAPTESAEDDSGVLRRG
jgi:hypothetical protein